MATNLALDDRLIEEARTVGGHKTKKDAVTAALAEYIQRRKQMRIVNLFGTIDYDPHYDYKAERRRKRALWCWLTPRSGLWLSAAPTTILLPSRNSRCGFFKNSSRKGGYNCWALFDRSCFRVSGTANSSFAFGNICALFRTSHSTAGITSKPPR